MSGTKERRGRPVKVLTGKYGKLTVLSQSDERTNYGGIQWLCKCDCGNTILRSSDYLKRNRHTKSCGCSKISKERGQNYERIRSMNQRGVKVREMCEKLDITKQRVYQVLKQQRQELIPKIILD